MSASYDHTSSCNVTLVVPVEAAVKFRFTSLFLLLCNVESEPREHASPFSFSERNTE